MASEHGTIVRPVADLHARADADSDVVSQAIYSTTVSLEAEQDGWLRIRTPDQYLGWVPAAAIERSAAPYAAEGRVAIVDSLRAHVYREASVTSHAPLLTVPYETRLAVVAEPDEEERRWIQVRLPGGREAWIQRGDVAFEWPRLSIDETITHARRFLGLPYTWGGASSFGFDCSGYTQMLYRRMGRSLPRDSRPQARWDGFEPVTRDELRPGDLIFFGESFERISHVGMYIGAGEFIHATAYRKPMVQISRLADAHWSDLAVAARRPK